MNTPTQNPASFGWRWLWAAVALAPWVAVYVPHFWSEIWKPTGFIMIDLPYYMANAREVFERGNGWTYPNPYDWSPEAPAIYFHWLMWVLGYSVKQIGLPVMVAWLGLGVLAAYAAAAITFRITQRLARRTSGVTLGFASLWGGGLLALGGVMHDAAIGGLESGSVVSLDPSVGTWFLNWGRNLTFPTEATYHALVALAWLSLINRQRYAAAGVVAVLAATHPFSGAQHLLILGGWFTLASLWTRRLEFLGPLLLTLAAMVPFGWYYGVYLPSYPSHQEIHATWQIDWSPNLLTLAFAYGPLLVFAGLRAVASRNREAGDPLAFREHDLFFLTAAGVSFLLANHHWFIEPRQPLHFTRGYLWFPLFLFCLPLFDNYLARLRQKLKPLFSTLAVAGLLLMASADNLTWTIFSASERAYLVALTPDQADMLQRIDEVNLRGRLFCTEEGLSYLVATYTPMRTYVGHQYLTPDYEARVEHTEAFVRGAAGVEVPDDAEFVLIPKRQASRLKRKLAGWDVVLENESYTLYKRR